MWQKMVLMTGKIFSDLTTSQKLTTFSGQKLKMAEPCSMVVYNKPSCPSPKCQIFTVNRQLNNAKVANFRSISVCGYSTYLIIPYFDVRL